MASVGLIFWWNFQWNSVSVSFPSQTILETDVMRIKQGRSPLKELWRWNRNLVWKVVYWTEIWMKTWLWQLTDPCHFVKSVSLRRSCPHKTSMCNKEQVCEVCNSWSTHWVTWSRGHVAEEHVTPSRGWGPHDSRHAHFDHQFRDALQELVGVWTHCVSSHDLFWASILPSFPHSFLPSLIPSFLPSFLPSFRPTLVSIGRTCGPSPKMYNCQQAARV